MIPETMQYVAATAAGDADVLNRDATAVPHPQDDEVLIRVAATDSSGNQGIDCGTVVVPHDGSRAALLAAVDCSTLIHSSGKSSDTKNA